MEQGAVYKTGFFKRPGAERTGSASSKNQFFPSDGVNELTHYRLSLFVRSSSKKKFQLVVHSDSLTPLWFAHILDEKKEDKGSLCRPKNDDRRIQNDDPFTEKREERRKVGQYFR